jgi:hypothetical protein
VQDATFHGAAEFTSRARLPLAWLQTWFHTTVAPDLFRIVITDTDLRIDGRWRSVRALLPSQSCKLSDLVSATRRERLVVLKFRDDEWWSVASAKAEQIIRALEAREVRVTIDP